MVADEKKPLGLAGIMGGEHSGIADDTTRVYLEGAFWSPAVIQGKMRRLGFASDAGYRFERGVDFDGCARAVERATQLDPRRSAADARVRSPTPSPPADLPRRDPVRVRTARIARLLGVAIADDAIADAFTRLGLPFTRDGGDFVVTPPSRRFDLAIEEDFVEEVARIHGYDRIPAAPARARRSTCCPIPKARRTRHAVKRTLADLDWQEVVTFGFVSSGDGSRARSAGAADQGAQSDRRAARRHAHVAAARPRRDADDQRQPQDAARAHVRARPHVPARGRRLRPAAAAGRPGLRAGRRPSNGARRPATSTSSTSRATSRRWPRRVTS